MHHSSFKFYICVENDLRKESLPINFICNSSGLSYIRNTAQDTYELLSASPKCFVNVRSGQHLDLCECCQGSSTTPVIEDDYIPGTPGDVDDPFVSWTDFSKKITLPLNSRDLDETKNDTNSLTLNLKI